MVTTAAVNPDLRGFRFEDKDQFIDPYLVLSGMQNGTCCYEYTLVNKVLLASESDFEDVPPNEYLRYTEYVHDAMLQQSGFDSNNRAIQVISGLGEKVPWLVDAQIRADKRWEALKGRLERRVSSSSSGGREGSRQVKGKEESVNQAWICEYFSTPGFERSQLRQVRRHESLASAWQIKPGVYFDGVPELNNQMMNFSVGCMSRMKLEAGIYNLIPFIKSDGQMKIAVDGFEILEHPGSHVLKPYLPKKLNPFYAAEQTLPIGLSPGYHTFSFSMQHNHHNSTRSNRAFAVLSIARGHLTADESRTSRELTDAEEVACFTSPSCLQPLPTERCKKQLATPSSAEEWPVCLDYMPNVTTASDCLVYSIGARELVQSEVMYGNLLGCEVHIFDCTVYYPEHLNSTALIHPNVTFHPWCVGKDESGLLLDGVQNHRVCMCAQAPVCPISQ